MPIPPPSSAAPTLVDAIAHLVNASADNTHNLQAMAQNMAPGQHGSHNPKANITYGSFLKTQPPIFTKVDEPLEVDEWI